MIIPVRVEESESGAIDIARDMGSMWPNATIESYARSETSNDIAYSIKLKQTTLQRLKVKDMLRSANTLPARGSLMTDSYALKKLINRARNILTDEHPPWGVGGVLNETPLQRIESEDDENDEDPIHVDAQDPPLPPGKARAEKIRNDAESGEDLPLYTANDYRMLF